MKVLIASRLGGQCQKLIRAVTTWGLPHTHESLYMDEGITTVFFFWVFFLERKEELILGLCYSFCSCTTSLQQLILPHQICELLEVVRAEEFNQLPINNLEELTTETSYELKQKLTISYDFNQPTKDDVFATRLKKTSKLLSSFIISSIVHQFIFCLIVLFLKYLQTVKKKKVSRSISLILLSNCHSKNY